MSRYAFVSMLAAALCLLGFAVPQPCGAASSGTLAPTPSGNQKKAADTPSALGRMLGLESSGGAESPLDLSLPLPDLPPVSITVNPAGSGDKKKSSNASALQHLLGLEGGGTEGLPLDLTMPIPALPSVTMQIGKEANDASVPQTGGAQAPSPPTPADDGAPPAAHTGRELEMQKRGIVAARLLPANVQVLASPVGANIASIKVKDGESVVKGQVVAEMDTAYLDREKEDIRQLMTAAVERVQNSQAASEQEKQAAQDALAQAAERLRDVEESQASASIKASTDGRVIEIRAKAGQMLKRGDSIMELAKPGDLEVVCTIPSTWVPRLQAGHIIWVFIEETNKSYEAEFVRFGGKVNAVTRTIRAYSALRKDHPELLPGMSGRADFFPRSGK
ncbi:HlyD family efflux transporter periplasmic adaptor subunit [Desulfovibrio sp. OttesenSCG-928-G15]|nr:HlyD family efflux transporter periplasmic adaptor subunit [Desulfovibrio sp. OttesenSCG-928-G15]